MRILLVSAMLSVLGLQLLDTNRAAAAHTSADAAGHEQARNELLTAEERFDIESRGVALAARGTPAP